MVRALLVLVAVVTGGLVGLQAGPAVWSLLEQLGLVATPVCTDTVGITAHALCSRPRVVVVVVWATVALCAAAAGTVTWRLLRDGATAPGEDDPAA